MAAFRSVLFIAALLVLAACGQKELSPPTSYWVKNPKQDPAPKTLLVFIHGVMGDSRSTWGKPGTANFLPQLLIGEPSVAPADAYVVAYASGPLSRASSIPEIATRVSTHLADNGIFTAYDKIVFVVHSMGGLIAKQMILDWAVGGMEQRMSKTKGVVFLSTPAQGSNVADFASWVSSNPQFANMQPAELNAYLQNLDNQWQTVMRTRKAGENRPLTACAYETQAMGIVIVPRGNAERFCDDGATAFDVDHEKISKPRSREDDIYIWIRARVRAAETAVASTRVEIRAIRENRSEVGFGESLRSGDIYWLELAVQPALWVYVVNLDGARRSTRLYPAVLDESVEPVSGALRIPAGERGIRLDRQKGQESFFVYAARERDLELEKTLAKIPYIGKNSPDAAQDVIDSFKTRGGHLVTLDVLPAKRPAPGIYIDSRGAMARFAFNHE